MWLGTTWSLFRHLGESLKSQATVFDTPIKSDCYQYSLRCVVKSTVLQSLNSIGDQTPKFKLWS
jgi:hypothetical protein